MNSRIRVSLGSEFVMFRLKKPTSVKEIKLKIETWLIGAKGMVFPYYLDGCSNDDEDIVSLGTNIYVFKKEIRIME